MSLSWVGKLCNHFQHFSALNQVSIFHVFFFKDCLTTGHIEGLQNLVDRGSISWTRNEVDLEQASKASCIIALCGWTGR